MLIKRMTQVFDGANNQYDEMLVDPFCFEKKKLH